MSRVSRAPIDVPKGIDLSIKGQSVTVKGKGGTLSHDVHPSVRLVQQDESLSFVPNEDVPNASALAGTTRALISNMFTGVSDGFERKLQLVGIGYRAQVQGKVLNLTLGFSHPIDFDIPDGIEIQTPSQTEVVVRGIDKQRVGQTAAVIRGFRPPEPYKGKGVRYADEHIVRKEAKKK